MASFFLIRHGRPSITGVMLGQSDPPLSPAGRAQAAEALAGLQVKIIWTSPLRRARETADLIPGAPVHELSQLREIDQGEWTGKTWTEIEANWPDLAAQKQSDWFGLPTPGGETWTDFLARIQTAWTIIRQGPLPAAIVAHQGVNAALMHLIAGKDPLEFNQQYSEVIKLDYD
jgi:broad specificity phosphatase PhoE